MAFNWQYGTDTDIDVHMAGGEEQFCPRCGELLSFDFEKWVWVCEYCEVEYKDE